MNKIFTFWLLAGVAVFASCKKDHSGDSGPTTPVNKIAPDGFNFSTSKDVSLNLTLQDNSNGPLAGVVVSVYAPGNTDPSAAIFRAVSDKSGKVTAKITVPASYGNLVIDPAYIGLMHNATAVINNNAITATIGGKTGYSGDIMPDAINSTSTGSSSTGKININGLLSTDIGYPTGYTTSNAFTSPTNQGRPAYLEATGDAVPASLLSYVNASLPEGTPLTTTHPQYLTTSVVNTINVTATSDVWVTFVSEGAGYQNTLAYYTYQTNNPPNLSGGTLLGGIDKITYIFPNASAAGSGGGLISGDKVKLGTFNAGTSIGFVLLQNAWTGSGVNTNATKFYTQDSFNPESTTSLKKHTVMLYDDVHKLYLLGFEDTNRQTGGSDNDFNDLVVYASANPITAISTNGVPAIDRGGDTDGDGVADAQDAFPNDATRAYISYYPSSSTYSTIAFEDNFPNKGDYDMNDLVVDYQYAFISNAANQVVELKGNFNVAAAGASFHNGFGVQLPVPASAVASVTGQQSISNYITFASNGVEAGQTKAVIIPFDNHEALIKNPDASFFINTQTSKDKVTNGKTAAIDINFATPVAASTLTVSAFNPFLISNLRRGYEAHLPGYAPTDKASTTLFGTGDDNSAPATGRYYLSKENWPWAINFSNAFSWPVEGVPINQAYLHFSDWASSSGANYIDWYTNTTSGYRNTSNIYSK